MLQKSQSQISGRNWCFTWIKPCKQEIESIQKINASVCKYIIYGHELTADGVEHLQGYIELLKPQRIAGIKKLLDPVAGKKSEVHVELAVAKRDLNKIYCSKGLQSHEEYTAQGINGPAYGFNANIYERVFTEVNEGRGKRSDWDELYDAIKANPNFGAILQEFPEKAIKYSTGIQRAITAIVRESSEARLDAEMNNLRLYIWEQELIEELENDPHKRKIIWYVDTIGGCGKTTFAKYLLSKGDCAYFLNSKTSDIAHAYNGERTVIFDYTRSMDGHLNMSIVEMIKNGLVFSPKYDSCNKINATPHVVCFSNFEPDQSTLSADRWDIRHLNKEMCVYPMVKEAAEVVEKTIAPEAEAPVVVVEEPAKPAIIPLKCIYVDNMMQESTPISENSKSNDSLLGNTDLTYDVWI